MKKNFNFRLIFSSSEDGPGGGKIRGSNPESLKNENKIKTFYINENNEKKKIIKIIKIN